MKHYNETQRKIYEMLTENTGTHMLDSGGAYGRNWERNQKKSIDDFYNEPEELYQLDMKYNEVCRTVSVFHFLSDLELCPICDEFNAINEKANNWEADADIYGVSTEAWEYLTEFNEVEVIRSWNTYNGESDLSQVLQGSELEINGEGYWLIQIHGGCDVRGGYTNARLFRARSGYRWEGIHEYLWEWRDSFEILDDMAEGYITEAVDYWDESIKYNEEQIKEFATKASDHA